MDLFMLLSETSKNGASEMTADAASKPMDHKLLIDSDILEAIRSGALESKHTSEILTWAIKNFHPRLVLSCSFGNPEGMVLLDMMHRIEPASRVFVLDTGRMRQETYDLIDRVRDRYRKEVEVVLPDGQAVQRMVNEHGMNLFYESLQKRQLCCRLRKVEPNERFLADLDAYVTGLRRDQNVTRSDIRKVEIERTAGGIVKVNPLVDWSQDDVWQYVRAQNVPVNRLHQQGFPSVGCAPCTRAVQAGEDPRAGRWWWENPETKECGLHVDMEMGGSGI
jgi:phosphoadenosine phosphosulfate reductase